MSKKGFGLVEVLVAGMLAIGVGYVVSKLTVDTFSLSKKSQVDFERIALMRHVLGLVNCTASFVPGVTCPSTAPVLLTDRNGTTLISKDPLHPTKLGEFTLKAECNSTGTGLVVKAIRLTPLGGLLSAKTEQTHFAADPITKRQIDWDDPKALILSPGINVCPDGVNPSFSDAVVPGSSVNWPRNFVCDDVGSGKDTIVFQFHAYLKDDTIVRYRDLYQRDTDFYVSNGAFKRCDSCGNCKHTAISAITKHF